MCVPFTNIATGPARLRPRGMCPCLRTARTPCSEHAACPSSAWRMHRECKHTTTACCDLARWYPHQSWKPCCMGGLGCHLAVPTRPQLRWRLEPSNAVQRYSIAVFCHLGLAVRAGTTCTGGAMWVGWYRRQIGDQKRRSVGLQYYKENGAAPARQKRKHSHS